MCNCNHQKETEIDYEKLGNIIGMIFPLMMLNGFGDKKLETRLSILEDEVNAIKKLI